MSSFQRVWADGDPTEVPVRSAATLMVVADRPELEVLLVQRTPRMAFGAGAWVFPGGRVDETDKEFGSVVDGLTDEQASTMLDLSEGGLAWWLAAVRETAEEAGLVLACASCTAEQLSVVRTAAARDDEEFFDALSAHQLRLDLSAVHEVARFVTPVGPPRRFDTRFFVAEAPPGQEVRHDPKELDDAKWFRPADAMDLWRSGELEMMSVTYRMLACLGRYPSVSSLMETAAGRPDPKRVRVNDPAGAYEVLLPGEPGYEQAELEVEHGWVRI
ncbi:MAG: NUDIX domain-containing protein [Acidimicrobiales bacterium]|nr:NUDIX domain-containing protein [Acidimicrobiales bacterium]RZV48495.1 MAG: NUDIX domain-containing protein [Acidimicrobiales bacterium]